MFRLTEEEKEYVVAKCDHLNKGSSGISGGMIKIIFKAKLFIFNKK